MAIDIHPHARERMRSRGASETEVDETIADGERFPAKHGRHGYRRNFSGEFLWRGRRFNVKQLEVYARYGRGSADRGNGNRKVLLGAQP